MSSGAVGQVRDGARSLAFSIASVVCLPSVLHRLAFPNQLTIVMYHGVVRSPLPVRDWCFIEERVFASHLAYLREHFAVTSFSEAVETLYGGAIAKPTVVLTFDDGFQSNYDVVYPMLKAANVPATIFLVTGLIGTERTVWFCRLHRAITETIARSLVWAGRTYDLSTASGRASTSATIQSQLKSLPSSLLDAQLRCIVAQLGDHVDRPVDVASPYGMPSREAVREMATSGLVEFGAHTRSHAILPHLAEAECRREITGSLEDVERLVGRPCHLFAYPNGRATDVDGRSVRALRDGAVRAAVTTIAGPNVAATPPLELRRYGIGADVSMAEFQTLVHHLRHKMRSALR